MNLLDTLLTDELPQPALHALLEGDSVISVLDALESPGPSVLDLLSMGMPTPVIAPVGNQTSLSGLSNAELSQLVDVGNQAYHADLSTVTRSKLELILRSPAHLQASLKQPRAESAAMLVGTALHAALLEPAVFSKKFIAYRGGKTRASSDYKEFVAANPDMIIMSDKDYDKVLGMRDAVQAVTDFPLWDVLQLAEKEKTLEWQDAETGLRCKIRPDALTSAAILDLKKTTDARPHKFMWSARDYGYDLQAAMYRIGVREALGLDLPFLFVAIEEDAPHGIQIYEAPKEMIADGERRYRTALKLYAECLRTDTWPNYSAMVDVLPWRGR
ncbi:PD-(D/E)XK nuclease-like domain-containing protein [Crenobacter sp. SG2305]|uniref:PD-(D/E)XK nuclease-like domain-containing protein n=1 Tax=Crenobacter oryzisoli TaxID=3056844 RepID=UPI0025AA563C|nr:PD-(D/E)XK nuclease-like domain-containing protein [Crenobacter sp. SG2305]MDN0082339.1 PD-(D/E)XK nuclease-like domain-containing protein [Crenobacter sp. SG2305]